MPCDPSELIQAARCQSCLTPDQHMEVQTYLLAVLAGVSPDPNTLLQQSRAFGAVQPMILQWMKTYLLCAYVGGVATSPTACNTPEKPVISEPVSTFGTTATIQWSLSTSAPSQDWVIRWGTVSGSYTNSVVVPLSPRSKLITGLSNSTTYYVVVEARNSDTCTTMSNEVSFETF